ncbi:MAG: VOC family protein [Opitutaceae bacterium]
MDNVINGIVDEYDQGRLTRRQLLGRLGALLAFAGGGARALGGDASPSAGAGATFEATALNHIALRVTDVARSRDFYQRHLGLKVSRDNESSAFLTCGTNFVALFRGNTPGLDHYCYSVPGYDADAAEEKLRANGLANIHRSGDRIYFDDPDGLTVQLAAEEHMPRRGI